MVSADQRLCDLKFFYRILDKLEARLGQRRLLGECHGKMGWPRRGVYFFFEDGEERTESGEGSRVVRVGTHALKRNSQTKIWNRLSQHRGRRSTGHGGGSIFRTHVGRALLNRDGNLPDYTWREIQPSKHERDYEMEKRISATTGKMHFLWLAVLDKPGPKSERGYIERNAIALLSNYDKPTVDEQSDGWLGKHADRKIHNSGLWNVNHVDEGYEKEFLHRLDNLVEEMKI